MVYFILFYSILFYLIFLLNGQKMKSCTQIYNWIYNCDIYQPPLLSLTGRDVNHFPKVVLIALKPIKTDRAHLEE